MIINQQNLNALFTGFNTIFNRAFDGAPSDYDKFSTSVPSTTAQETYPWLGRTTKFREWLGDRVIQNLEAHTYSIRNKPWENSIGVPRDNIEDDTYGVFNPMFDQLGRDSKEHPDTLVFPLLQAGHTTRCYDGQYFFDVDHPVGVAGQGSGIQSVANCDFGGNGPVWYLMDVSRAIRPIIFQKRKDYVFTRMDQQQDEAVFMRKEFRYGVDSRSNVGFGLWQLAYASNQPLDAAHYGAARAAMMGLKGDNGRPMGIRPNLLVVPGSLEQAALNILKADTVAATTNVFRSTADLLVSPWLS